MVEASIDGGRGLVRALVGRVMPLAFVPLEGARGYMSRRFLERCSALSEASSCGLRRDLQHIGAELCDPPETSNRGRSGAVLPLLLLV